MVRSALRRQPRSVLRGNIHAEEEIRTVAIEMWRIAMRESPAFFSDFELRKENGIDVLWTAHTKV